MKKLIFASAILFASVCAMTSCSGDEPACWKITYNLGNASIDTYYYMTGNQLDAALSELMAAGADDIDKEKVTDKSRSECMMMNIQ